MPRRLRRYPRTAPILVLLLLLVLMGLPSVPNNSLNLTRANASAATTFTVNSTGDGSDSNPGDGVCNDGTGACTLRAAIEETNANAIDDEITFAVSLNGTITLSTALPDINGNLTILGPGASLLTVQRSTAGGTPNFRIFTINSGTTVSISGLTISNGLFTSTGNGGGIFNDGGTVDLTNTIVSGNTAVNGGGIMNNTNGVLSMTDSTVSGNTANGGAGGGIINNSGTLALTNSTISGNTCSFQGGGLTNLGGFTLPAGIVTLTNSTVSGNTATQNGGTGGIYNGFSNNTLTLSNSTVTGNIASGTGGGGVAGIFNATGGGGSTFNINNSIVANNTPANGSGIFHDLNGTFTSQGYNLIGISNGTNGFTNGMNGDQVGTPAAPLDPLLGPLGNNRGPTFTHTLLQGSPAIDSANSSLITDQRGQPRPVDDLNVTNAPGGNATDVGSYEAHTFEVNSTADTADGTCTGIGTGNGCTLREAIIAANAETGAEVITFAPALTSGGPATISLLTVLPDLASDMAIAGPGASSLLVERSHLGGTPDFRVFKVTSGKSVAISGLAVANGVASGASPGNLGGNLLNDQGIVEINNCLIIDSVAGGALGNFSGSMTINGSTLSGNNGGATVTNTVPSSSSTISPATLTINSSTLTGNSGNAINNSVIIGNAMSPAMVTINNSTIFGNSINGIGSAAGVRNGVGVGGTATITINNSTISGNTNSDGSGAIYNAGVFTGSTPTIATVTVSNGTIFGNTGGTSVDVAGGIANIVSSCGGCLVSVKLNNTILAGNLRDGGANASDFNGTADPTSSSNLIGIGGSGGLINGVNNNQVGIANVRLAPLANNGGPTQTHAFLSGSPALDAGDNALATNLGLTTDQRGAGFLRIRDGADADTTQTVDIGAFEADPSVEDIADKSTPEDTPISFSFNVGDSATAFDSITATSSNTTLVPNAPANLSVAGSSSTRTLDITPAADKFGTTLITVTATKTISGTPVSMSDTFVLTVGATADTPSVTNATANEDSQNFSGLVITRNAGDGTEVTHFKITGITNGTLFKNNNVTPINNGDFILVSEGGAGLRFHPNPNFFGAGSFNVQASIGNTDAGLGGGTATATITVNPVAETPTVTDATTFINTQTSSGLVINRNVIDGTEVTHFRIESIQNGTLFKNDGTTQITNFASITVAEGNVGLKFTPATNLFSPTTTFSFQVRGATSAGGSGLGGAATATITVSCNASSVVTNTNDSGAGSLRDAILKSCPGGAITFNIPTSDPGFSGGVYAISLTSGELIIDRNLTITGLGADVLTVRRSAAGGTPNFRVFTITAGNTVTISGLTIANGRTADGVPGNTSGGSGGGISNSGTLTLSNTIVTGNSTGIGGDFGHGGDGGGIYNSGTLTLNSCAVSDNTTGMGGPAAQGGGGGGVYNSGTLNLNTSVISGNQAGNGGNGSAGGYGGGIFNNGNSTLILTNTTVSGNQSGAGGMVPGAGGGIACSGTVTLTNSTVTGNHTPNGNNGNGGGISSSGTLTLNNSTVSDNFTGTSAGGGGIYVADGTLALIDSIISGNQTPGSGGGINSFRPVTAVNCEITNNSASTGGGLVISSINPTTLVNTTISGNSSTGIGGGMWVASSTVLTNLTITNNRSDSDNSGGEQGGGIYTQGTRILNNSIVAGNFRGSSPSTTADDVANTLNAASSYNLIGTGGSGGLTNGVNNNLVGVADPRLAVLANNGGLTQTHALLSGSVAIDAANNAFVANPPFSGPPFTDQRGSGFARIVDGPDADTMDTVDIGAFEAQVSVADIADQAINEDGSLSLPFNVGGAASITSVTATSSNTTLVPNNPANISLSGSGSTRTLLINPVANAFGTSTVTVTVNGNNSQTMTDTFLLTVNAVNDVPLFTQGLDQTVNENGGAQTVNNWASNISAGPANESGQAVNFVVVSNSNASLFAVAPVVSPTGALTYTPATGVSGTALITIALMDNGGTANGGINTSANQTFNITVREGGALQFSSATFSRAEDGGNAVITVSRTGGTAGEARVNYATSNGSATAGQDYTSASGTLIFPDGITSQSFNVAVTNDAVDEPDETVNLTLTSPAGSGSLGTPASAVLTINDNDPTPGISINDVAITEGDSGTVNAIFNVSLSGQSSQTVTVNFATANGTATGGNDYQTSNGTVTFLPLETTKPISVTVNGDISFEPSETFLVNLSNPVNATMSDNQGQGTILNDDAQGGFISFSQSNYTVGESGGFTTITVNRTNDLSSPATVDYATTDDSGSTTVVPCSTANGIASSRCDFTTAMGTLRFAVGESSKTFVVLISQDNYVEGSESLTLTLSNLTGGAALATPSTATLTITDDATEPATNPIDVADTFVRQHYHDFLNREPDAAGLAFWTNQITECQQPGATCSAEVRRINVSAAFFLSIEFQETGYLVHRLYKTAYGTAIGVSSVGGFHSLSVPIVRLSDFLPDTQAIGRGVTVGAPGWEQVLENNKVAFVSEFVQRARFRSTVVTSMSPEAFIDRLFLNAEVTPSASDRQAAIDEFGGAMFITDITAQARALRRVAENSILKQQESNRAFVLAQYFGYLRRNPNDSPDSDYTGYDFWLTKLEQFNGNFINAEMVKAFIISGEYRQRFGP